MENTQLLTKINPFSCARKPATTKASGNSTDSIILNSNQQIFYWLARDANSNTTVHFTELPVKFGKSQSAS